MEVLPPVLPSPGPNPRISYASFLGATSSELLPSRLNATFTNPGEKRGKEQKAGEKKGQKKREESKGETAVKLTKEA